MSSRTLGGNTIVRNVVVKERFSTQRTGEFVIKILLTLNAGTNNSFNLRHFTVTLCHDRITNSKDKHQIPGVPVYGD